MKAVQSDKQLALMAAEAAFDKKGLDILVLDVKGMSTVTDYLIVASGRSDTHLRALADNVEEALEKAGRRPWKKEGYREGTWILLDYAGFIVNLMQIRRRGFYNLEELWAKAKVIAQYQE